jgi:hypothetical protein
MFVKLTLAGGLLSLALFATSPAATNMDASQVTYWQKRGCDHGHPSKVSYKTIKRLLRVHQPIGDRFKRAKHYAVCTTTHKKSRAVWDYIRRSLAWRKQYYNYWKIVFARYSSTWQSWARITGSCESGNNAAINAYHDGAFQFLPSTWTKAVSLFGGGSPSLAYLASYEHQAVVAIRWRQYTSASQWPNCAAW